jgi:hypothetical protein
MNFTPVKLDRPKRLYTYNRGVYFTYKTKYCAYENEHFDNAPWESVDEWFAFIAVGRTKKLFDYCCTEYDWHTVSSVTIFGLTFGHGFSWMATSLKDDER